ncbi:unnamed protein product [Angiostrongylus costaricensis]|uniref:Galactosylgalactosylxylosylprotein 3-beta-glucuronosyltransferase n=1 Tax=Angiostrongylus costaricensis TaxID=334426 RepID=A0A158PMD6_ANGCS|nr:unnamed protein product [Angiostrongylus costaricensis]
MQRIMAGGVRMMRTMGRDPRFATVQSSDIQIFESICGRDHVETEDVAHYKTDWTKAFRAAGNLIQSIPVVLERGWYQRTCALQFLRNETESVIGNHKRGVVYFGDDDNSYDTRLFTDYIRNVKKLGMWAVGLAGGGPLESPVVVNGTVVGYKTQWRPERKFGVDMAGFAVNLNDVLRTTVVFGKSCKSGFDAPEPCFLDDMGFNQTDIEPFGVGEYSDKVSLITSNFLTKQSNQNYQCKLVSQQANFTNSMSTSKTCGCKYVCRALSR